jgi:hypothetical protein
MINKRGAHSIVWSVLVLLGLSLSPSAFAQSHGGGHGGPGPRPTPAPTPAPPVATRDVYRFNLRGHHFYTISYREGIRAGGQYEGAFAVLAASLPSTHLIYRCYVPNSNDHFISVNANCEGQNIEGPYGYVYNNQVRRSQPMYRCYGNGDHLETGDTSECTSNGYRVEGILGYIPN